MTNDSHPQESRYVRINARGPMGTRYTPTGTTYKLILSEYQPDPGLLYVATAGHLTLTRDGAIELATRLVEFAETMAPTHKRAPIERTSK